MSPQIQATHIAHKKLNQKQIRDLTIYTTVKSIQVEILFKSKIIRLIVFLEYRSLLDSKAQLKEKEDKPKCATKTLNPSSTKKKQSFLLTQVQDKKEIKEELFRSILVKIMKILLTQKNIRTLKMMMMKTNSTRNLNMVEIQVLE